MELIEVVRHPSPQDFVLTLNCERHIADLKLRIAQLKEGSGVGSDVLPSAEFIDLLQQTLDGWEHRKKTLAEHH